jgi:hypothetical protein
VRQLADEVLVYDLEQHRAVCLNRSAAAVWERCDGEHDVEAIGREVAALLGAPFGTPAVWCALDALEKRRLVEPLADAATRRRRTRREWLNELGAAGLSATLLPTVLAVLAPSATEAATFILEKDCTSIDSTNASTCPGTPCTTGGTCVKTAWGTMKWKCRCV